MKILGADLSLTGTGLVVLTDGKVTFQKLIKSKPQGDKPKDELQRLIGIIRQVKVEGIDLVVVEGIAFGIRKTTSLAQLSALNYLVRMQCWENSVPFVIVSPNTLKKFITGKGVGEKDQMMLAAYKKWDFSPSDNNICDAFGLAQIGKALLDKKGKYLEYEQEVINLLKSQI